MNEDIIRRLREPQLRISMRGYDRLEVDALLHDLADLIEARGLGVDAPEAAVGELPGVADRVQSILTSATEAAQHVSNESVKRASEVTQEAEQAAEHMRREADEYATETRASADRYADETRSSADTDATTLREEAERMAEASSSAAEEQAAEIVREAEIERDRVKASIAELREQRRGVLESIERLRGNLDSMVGGVEKGTEQFIALTGGTPAPGLEDEIDDQAREMEIVTTDTRAVAPADPEPTEPALPFADEDTGEEEVYEDDEEFEDEDAQEFDTGEQELDDDDEEGYFDTGEFEAETRVVAEGDDETGEWAAEEDEDDEPISDELELELEDERPAFTDNATEVIDLTEDDRRHMRDDRR